MDWQPFSTAPKDGTPVLLRGPRQAVVARWGDIEPADFMAEAPHEPHWCWMTSGDCKNGPSFLRLDYLEPTHWMAIPE